MAIVNVTIKNQRQFTGKSLKMKKKKVNFFFKEVYIEEEKL